MADAEQSRPWVGQDSRARHDWYERQLRQARARGRHVESTLESPGDPERSGSGRHAAEASAAGLPEGAAGRRPGSDGERRLQQRLGTADRAERFYDEQVLDRLNERMREFIARQEMFFLATSDASGECDSSFRAGPPGFLQVLGARTVAFPEYRGNGVHASLGNIEENPHLGILMIDFTRARIGLHVNGSATIVEDAEMRARFPHLPEDSVPGRRAQVWVQVEVEEAYIHCAKHIPQLQKAPRRTARDWGTDDYKRKGGDFFGVARDRRDGRGAAEPALPEPAAAEPAVPEPALSEPALSERPLSEPALSEPPLPEPALPGPALAELPPRRPVPSASEAAQEPDVPRLPPLSAVRETPGTTGATPGTPGTTGTTPGTTPEPLAPAASSDSASASSLFGEPPAPAAPTSSSAPSASDRPGVPAQRRAPDRRLADVSIASNASLFFGSVASADTGEARAAKQQEATPRVRPPYAFDTSDSDPRAWREEAERALAEAQRRGAMSDAGSFGGWFG